MHETLLRQCLSVDYFPFLVCLEADRKEDAAKKLKYKAGFTDDVFPEEMTNIPLLKLLPQTEHNNTYTDAFCMYSNPEPNARTSDQIILMKGRIAGDRFFTGEQYNVTPTSRQHCSLLQQRHCDAVIDFLQRTTQRLPKMPLPLGFWNPLILGLGPPEFI